MKKKFIIVERNKQLGACVYIILNYEEESDYLLILFFFVSSGFLVLHLFFFVFQNLQNRGKYYVGCCRQNFNVSLKLYIYTL